MKTKQYWLSIVSGAGLVLIVFILGWSSSYSNQQTNKPSDRVTLKVNSLVAVEPSLSGHYMLSSDSVMTKDTIRFVSSPSTPLPKSIHLAKKRKYLIVDDDIVFMARGIVEDKIPFGNLGIVDDDIVFLNIAPEQDTLQRPLPQGAGLQWNELNLQDSTLHLTDAALSNEQPAYVFARDLSFAFLDAQYFTVMGFKYDENGKAEKGIWKFKLSELKGLYKAKASEHIYSQWKELWVYKR
ncbi:MAG: hypothetical protein KTR30_16835 [Saprospiraceae bacterium]|nr:hypothetical protein [Saprospiraceae bacterium]